MTKSREDLVRAVLAIVGADGGSGQAPAAEDVQFVDACLPSVLSTLASLDVYPYGDPDQIEEDAFEYLALCIAHAPSIRGRYDFPQDPVAIQEAHTILRQITAATLSYQRQQAEYF